MKERREGGGLEVTHVGAWHVRSTRQGEAVTVVASVVAVVVAFCGRLL